MKNKFSVILLTFLILLGTTSSALAKKSDMTIQVIPEEYVYRMDTKYHMDKWDWQHEARNGTSSTDSVQRTVSRSKTTSLNVTADAKAGVIFAKVGISAEVAIGEVESETTSRTYSIPGNTRTMCQFGSALVTTTGYLDTYYNGKLERSEYVNGDWTYMSISNSYVIEYNYTGSSQL